MTLIRRIMQRFNGLTFSRAIVRRGHKKSGWVLFTYRCDNMIHVRFLKKRTAAELL